MGADPKNSVVNENCQTHDVPNLFVVGASVFPSMSGYPPTATVAALSYRMAEFVLRQRHWFVSAKLRAPDHRKGRQDIKTTQALTRGSHETHRALL
jgi:choline dehydrogenase-like flavoprotein